jgi:peptidoglycan/LPS O-acetylase OafA/YrhL
VLFVVALAYKLLVLKGLGSQPITITPKLLALPAYLDQFALGMLLAVTTLWLEDRETLPRPLAVVDRWPWLPWLAAAVAFWAVATQVGLPRTIYTPITATEYMERHLLYAAVGLGLLLPAVIGREDRGWVRRLMSTRVLVYLGLVSYGIYLYNLLVMSKLNAWGADDLLPIGRYGSLVVTGFVVTVIAAALSWHFVERPSLSLKGRVPARTPAVRDGREA